MNNPSKVLEASMGVCMAWLDEEQRERGQDKDIRFLHFQVIDFLSYRHGSISPFGYYSS